MRSVKIGRGTAAGEQKRCTSLRQKRKSDIGGGGKKVLISVLRGQQRNDKAGRERRDPGDFGAKGKGRGYFLRVEERYLVIAISREVGSDQCEDRLPGKVESRTITMHHPENDGPSETGRE